MQDEQYRQPRFADPLADVRETVPETEHECHIPYCHVRIPLSYLMCAPHWRKVPNRLARRVKKYFAPQQCYDKRPSREWVHAAREAITWVICHEEVP